MLPHRSPDNAEEPDGNQENGGGDSQYEQVNPKSISNQPAAK